MKNISLIVLFLIGSFNLAFAEPWPKLIDRFKSELQVSLTAVEASKRLPVNIMCDNFDCRDLSRELVDIFKSSGWKATLVTSGFSSHDSDGYRCEHNDVDLCTILTNVIGVAPSPVNFALPGKPREVIHIMFGNKL